jgi:hypothetical protein
MRRAMPWLMALCDMAADMTLGWTRHLVTHHCMFQFHDSNPAASTALVVVDHTDGFAWKG